MPSASKVVVCDCQGYQPALVREAVNQALEALEPLPLSPGDRVLLKPNLLSPGSAPEDAINTRSEVVLAVGSYLNRVHKAKLLIADSGGIGHHSRAEKAYHNMGLDRVAEELSAELLNLETLGLIELQSPTAMVLDCFEASAVLSQVDVIVNLPKLKTHMLTGVTGAVKNCLGLLPGSLKRDVHVAAPMSRQMSAALVDIFAAIKPAINLMDAVVCMEGNGPNQGRPIELNLIAASLDAVALDYVACCLIGLNPASVHTVTLAAQAGLGVGQERAIDLKGVDFGDMPLKKFSLPLSFRARFVQRLAPKGFVGNMLHKFMESKPRPVKGNCVGCGLCVESCPAGALSLGNGAVAIDKDRCIECYCCLEHCSDDGLRMPHGIMDRLLSGR